MQIVAPAFRLGRVLAGVLAGLVLLALGALGWVGYRTAAYHRHENVLIAKYRSGYNVCVAGVGNAAQCAALASRGCQGDTFWSDGKPFDFGLGSEINEASLRCKFGPASAG